MLINSLTRLLGAAPSRALMMGGENSPSIDQFASTLSSTW
jgi:hypothetical protein